MPTDETEEAATPKGPIKVILTVKVEGEPAYALTLERAREAVTEMAATLASRVYTGTTHPRALTQSRVVR